MIKTVSNDQNEIIASIMELTGIKQFDVDLTYGNGVFWKKFQKPKKCFDIDPQTPEVIQADSSNVPLDDKQVNSVMFDPPFVTYVRTGRSGNGNMVMAKRFEIGRAHV